MDKRILKGVAVVTAAVYTILMSIFVFDSRGYGDSYSYYYGDLNGDEVIDDSDLDLLGRFLTGRKTKSVNLWAGDINDDNKVNVLDYIFLKRMLAYGIYPGEPVPGTQQPSQSPADPDDVRTYMEEVLRLVNIEREKVGASPLTLNDTMCEAADKRAQEIVAEFSHTRPDGRNCFTVMGEYGVNYHYVGENIAAGSSTPADTMEQWVNSSGHYANIINSKFTELGVGYAYVPNSKYKYYWVQLFRQP